MKALEILRDIQDSKWCGVKPTLAQWKLKDFDEAIKELEKLQNRVLELEAIDKLEGLSINHK